MRYPSLKSIEQIIESLIAESTTLEYKSQLSLATTNERKELLKDMTGLGNGGGGTIIFGMDEHKESNIAKCLTPLPNLSLLSQIEDIVLSSISPPLVWSHQAFEIDGGWIIVADVEQSTLGPYMVDAYGEQRFYKRSGTKVHRMSEQEVRDGYSIAIRSAERRDQLWKDHFLPLRMPDGPICLAISALPEEPLTEIIDSRLVDLGWLTPSQDIEEYLGLSSLSLARYSLRNWFDGITSEVAATETSDWLSLRIHRDGAIGIAQEIRYNTRFETIWRILNAFLRYASWIWDRFSLQRPIEIEVAFLGLRADEKGDVFRLVVEPLGVKVENITIHVNELPWELARARVRHRIVRRFADRFVQSIGESSVKPMFEHGWLYNRSGERLQMALDAGRLWNPIQAGSVANIGTDGQIWSLDGEVRAFVFDGVVIDRSGDTLALLEMATGAGCPDDFLPRINEDSTSPKSLGTVPVDSHFSESVPSPTGRWSDQNLQSLIERFV